MDSSSATYDLDANMQGKRGAVAFDEDLKAIIYAGQKADFSTFAHETFHVSLRQMGQLEQFRSAVTEASQKPEFITWLDEHAELFADSVFDGMNAQDLADIASGFTKDNWGRRQEEFAARLYEGYLADGKTASSKLQQLLQPDCQVDGTNIHHPQAQRGPRPEDHRGVRFSV